MMTASPMSVGQGSVPGMNSGTPMAMIQPGTPQQQHQQIGPNTAVPSPKVLA